MFDEPLFQIGVLFVVVILFYYILRDFFAKSKVVGSTTMSPFEANSYRAWNSETFDDNQWSDGNYDDTLQGQPLNENFAPVTFETFDDASPQALGPDDETNAPFMMENMSPVDLAGYNGEVREHMLNPQDIMPSRATETVRQNFLQATGVDRLGKVTINQPKRYLSNDLRYVQPNPRTTSTIWNNSTIEGDVLRKKLDDI